MARDHKAFLATRTGRAALATLAATAILGATLGAPGRAEAQRSSGIQLTPDSRQYLINKDVPPNQRWAITWNLNDDTITGNVFFTDDSAPPQFLWCEEVNERPSPNPAESEYDFRCFAAGPCDQAPCSSAAYLEIATVTLNGAFLFPPGTSSTLSGNIQPIFTATCATNLTCHVAGGAGPVNLSAGQAYAQIFEIVSTQDPSKFYVDAFDPALSYLFNKVEGTGIGSQMPLGLPPLPQDQQDAIRNWILEGAVNN
jgi:hypothetical protein